MDLDISNCLEDSFCYATALLASADDSDDDSSPEKDGDRKEVKNRKERERVEKMNAAFVELQDLLSLSAKTTKHDTLVAAVGEIQRLEYEIIQIAGRCTVPKPLGRKRSRIASKKRPPNKFLQFSKAFRGTFLRLLQDYRSVDRIDNREVTKFLSVVWKQLDDEERAKDWTAATFQDRKRCSSLAMSMLTEGQGAIVNS